MPRRLFQDAEHWHDRAEDARKLAAQIPDPASRRTMLEIAESYDSLARRAAQRPGGYPDERKMRWRTIPAAREVPNGCTLSSQSSLAFNDAGANVRFTTDRAPKGVRPFAAGEREVPESPSPNRLLASWTSDLERLRPHLEPVELKHGRYSSARGQSGSGLLPAQQDPSPWWLSTEAK
jgi:hypothetical protein